jgi:hypothetical protein
MILDAHHQPEEGETEAFMFSFYGDVFESRGAPTIQV